MRFGIARSLAKRQRDKIVARVVEHRRWRPKPRVWVGVSVLRTQSSDAPDISQEGIVMSGRRPLIKGYFGVALVASAVMSSAFFCGE